MGGLFEGYMVEGKMAITCRGLMKKLERMPLMAVVMAILCGVLRFAPHVCAQNSSFCASANLSGSSGRTFQRCQQLPKLGATLGWTLREDENAIDFAFSDAAPSSGGWVGWGINPTAAAMVGSQALIAFKSTEGPVVYTYNLSMGLMSPGFSLTPGHITLNFTNSSAEILGTQLTIYATLNLNANESLQMNHVWNRGSSVNLTSNSPGPHSFTGENIQSVLPINLSTGATSQVELPHQKLKNRHGIINAVAWGFLLPVGVMAARYLRPICGANNPLWFYVHVSCQCTGYILGVAGWGLGMKLQSYNKGAIFYKHRNLGIAIFAFATFQMLAVIWRPNKQHVIRAYWNVSHHTMGYTTIILILVNVFEGLRILDAGNKWRDAYIAAVIVLGGTSMVLEIITWTMWLKRPQNISPMTHHAGSPIDVTGKLGKESLNEKKRDSLSSSV